MVVADVVLGSVVGVALALSAGVGVLRRRAGMSLEAGLRVSHLPVGVDGDGAPVAELRRRAS
jgi:hypothetical protein